MQCAMHGVPVAIVERDAAACLIAEENIRLIEEQLTKSLVCSASDIQDTKRLIQVFSDGREWACKSDLLIESVTEDREIKRAVFSYYGSICPPETIFATNSSYMLPSTFIKASGRAERLLGLHFHVPVWRANAVDVMPHTRTDPQVVEQLRKFAIRIGQVPIVAKREYPGYVFNALLNPLLVEALSVARKGVVDPDQVDLAWRTITKMEVGPFDMIRLIGPETVERILNTGAELLGNQQLMLNARYLNGLAKQWESRSASIQRNAARRYSATWEPAQIDKRLDHRFQPAGAACLIGNPLATKTLFDELEVAGATSVLFTDSEIHATDNLSDQLCDALERCPHLFLLLHSERPCAQDLEPTSMAAKLADSLDIVKRWWQCWGTGKDTAGASLTITTNNDCGLEGMAYALFAELQNSKRLFPVIKLLELQGGPDTVHASQIVYETAVAQAEVVTGQLDEFARRWAQTHVQYVGQQRHRSAYVQSESTGYAANASDVSEKVKGTRWLVVGNGGEMSHQMALRLGQLGANSVVLLGRVGLDHLPAEVNDACQLKELRRRVMREAYESGRRPDDEWASVEEGMEIQSNLRQIRDTGISCEYVKASLEDQDRFAVQLRQVYQQGSFDGVIFGNERYHAKPFLKGSRDGFLETVNRNLLGLETLLRHFGQLAESKRPGWIFVNQSLASRFGVAKQVDLALAEGVAASTVKRLRQNYEECRVSIFGWPQTTPAKMVISRDAPGESKDTGEAVLRHDEALHYFEQELIREDSNFTVTMIDPAPDSGPARTLGGFA